MKFTIKYEGGKYEVSRPNYPGGEVVTIHEYNRAIEALKRLYRASPDTEGGELGAALRQAREALIESAQED